MTTQEDTDYEMDRYMFGKKSWIDIGKLPEELSNANFTTLWNIHPKKFGEVKIYGKLINTPRWQQSYGRDYKFSGITHKALPFPAEFKPFLKWVNTLDYEGEFNQILANWYENGLHNIGKHSDSETDHVKGAPIISISLGETRTFRLRKIGQKGIYKDIELSNGTVLVMGGNFQREFTHEIPKITGEKGKAIGKRVNITIRQFV
jgi:alkylated DNA repair dioxygenase AlkB